MKTPLADWFSQTNNETSKSAMRRSQNGFFEKYLAGDVILDIGYRGSSPDAVPVLPRAIGVDVDYPGYDGLHLPFERESVDVVYSSHVLEHVELDGIIIWDWFRVLKYGGFLIVIVPHQLLYERKARPPSLWNGDHKRFYTPASLLRSFEVSLEPNSYRVRHLCDNDADYDYSVWPNRHAQGAYEVECVLEKIRKPEWSIIP